MDTSMELRKLRWQLENREVPFDITELAATLRAVQQRLAIEQETWNRLHFTMHPTMGVGSKDKVR